MTSSPASPSAAARRKLLVLTLAMMGAVALFAAVSALVVPRGLPPVWAWAALAAMVLLAVLMAQAATRSLGALPAGAGESEAWDRVRAVHVFRLAMLEAPAVLGVFLGFLTGSWWLCLAAAATSLLAIAALALPHAGLLRRYERVLNADGAAVRLTD